MNDISNLSFSIVPKSDQLNADQLLAGPMTITVTGVAASGGDDQPISVHYEGENGRPFKPCKSMRKVLIFAWGENGNDWIGRSMTLYNDPRVKWAGVEVGGIRISHMSHIKADINVSLAVTKGKKAPVVIKRLQQSAPVQQAPGNQPQAQQPTIQNMADLDAIKKTLTDAAENGTPALTAAWTAIGVDARKTLGQAFLAPLKTKAAEIDKNGATTNE